MYVGLQGELPPGEVWTTPVTVTVTVDRGPWTVIPVDDEKKREKKTVFNSVDLRSFTSQPSWGEEGWRRGRRLGEPHDRARAILSLCRYYLSFYSIYPSIHPSIYLSTECPVRGSTSEV